MGASLESSRPIMAPSVSTSSHRNYPSSQPANDAFHHTAILQARLPLQHLQHGPLRRQHSQDLPLLCLRPTRNQRNRRRPREAGEQEAGDTALRTHTREERELEQVSPGSEAGASSGTTNGRTRRSHEETQGQRRQREGVTRWAGEGRCRLNNPTIGRVGIMFSCFGRGGWLLNGTTSTRLTQACNGVLFDVFFVFCLLALH